MRKAAATQAQAQVRIQIEDSIAKPDVFRLTAARVAAARRRNPAATRHMRISHGEDLRGLERWLARADGLVCSADLLLDPRFPLRRLKREAPRLRWIHATGAGIDKLLPLDWLHPGLHLTNNSGVHRAKMYEFALMALTMLNARVPAMVTQQANARWVPTFTPTCRGRTAVVIGTGDLGGAFGRAARHLGMRSVGVSRSGRRVPGFDSVQPVRSLGALLGKADVLVIAAPLTSDTRGLVGARELDQLKRGAGLVNVGRGPIVDATALARRLRSGRLSGALLDVFDREPLPGDSPLWKAPNLCISPHCSSDDADQYIPLTLDLALDNARRLALGRRLRNVVDPRRQY